MLFRNKIVDVTSTSALEMKKNGIDMRVRSLVSQIQSMEARKELIRAQVKTTDDPERKESLRRSINKLEQRQESLKVQAAKLREQKTKLTPQKTIGASLQTPEKAKQLAMRLVVANTLKRIELSFGQEDFDGWDKKKQAEWLKEHPDSKFGKAKSPSKEKPVAKKPVEKPVAKKPKATAEQKEADFKEIMDSKSEEDRAAFTAARAKGIAIPPAWVDVKFYGEAVNGVLAQGTDAKGRRQRIEDPEYRTQKIQEKHTRINETLEPKFDSIVRRLKKQTAYSEEAKVLYLISQTAFRIGGTGDGKTDHTAYGASTLKGEHVSIDGDVVTFDFIGKEGVRQVHKIRDPIIAGFLKDKPADEKLFNTNEEKVRKAWKSLGGEKVHDIRSVLATRVAKKHLAKSMPPFPATAKDLQRLQKEAAEIASKKLGNRPSEALNTYIDKAVFPALPEER